MSTLVKPFGIKIGSSVAANNNAQQLDASGTTQTTLYTVPANSYAIIYLNYSLYSHTPWSGMYVTTRITIAGQLHDENYSNASGSTKSGVLSPFYLGAGQSIVLYANIQSGYAGARGTASCRIIGTEFTNL